MKGSDDVVKTVSQLRFGDLIEVEWWDHSKREIRLKAKGKRGYITFDVPVQSAGWFFGTAKNETEHVILIRDIFKWPEMEAFDVDAVAILVSATKDIKVKAPKDLSSKLVPYLKAAWEKGRVRIVKRGKRLRLRADIEVAED